MSLLSDKTILFLVKYVLIPAVVIKLIYSISLFYLDKDLFSQSDGGNLSFITKTRLAYKVLDTKKAEPKNQEVIETGKKITDFKLKGTYVAGDRSFVIIDDAGSTEFIYMGESYQGYKLIKVYENKAIFDKNGITYELTMYSLINNYTTDELPKSSKKVPIDGDYVVPIDLEKEDVTYYAQNPDKIWNNIQIRDYRTQNGIEFKVGYVRRGTIFDKIGLKVGDIITAIDGQTPQSMADVMKYYSNINSLDSLVLTIKRKGQEMDLEFRIKE
jgi:general secretion pathway protein C